MPFQKGNKLGERKKGIKRQPFSEETRKKMSVARMGKIPWNKGKKGVQSAWNKGYSGYRKQTAKWKHEQSERLKEQWRSGMRSSEHTKGSRNGNWKGGTTDLKMRIRKLSEYIQWRRCVYERDNFTCGFCNQVGGKLTVDHIVPFSFLLNEHGIGTVEDAKNCSHLWDTENGRTLCLLCHRKTGTWGRRSNNYAKIP